MSDDDEGRSIDPMRAYAVFVGQLNLDYSNDLGLADWWTVTEASYRRSTEELRGVELRPNPKLGLPDIYAHGKLIGFRSRGVFYLRQSFARWEAAPVPYLRPIPRIDQANNP